LIIISSTDTKTKFRGQKTKRSGVQKEPKGDIWERSEQKTNERSELMGGTTKKGALATKSEAKKSRQKRSI
jgi:hypothetical protein